MARCSDADLSWRGPATTATTITDASTCLVRRTLKCFIYNPIIISFLLVYRLDNLLVLAVCAGATPKRWVHLIYHDFKNEMKAYDYLILKSLKLPSVNISTELHSALSSISTLFLSCLVDDRTRPDIDCLFIWCRARTPIAPATLRQ